MFASGIGAYFLGNAIVNDLNIYLMEIDETASLEENHFEATKQLTDFVKIHAHLKQLSELFHTNT